MSMNFNSSAAPTPTPAPKKNNNKLIAEIIIAVVIAAIAATTIMFTVMEAQDKMEGSSYQPSASEIRERCINTLRDITDSEPTNLAVNICVGTVLQELNK